MHHTRQNAKPANSRDHDSATLFRTRTSPLGLKGSVGNRTAVRFCARRRCAGIMGNRDYSILPADLTACENTLRKRLCYRARQT